MKRNAALLTALALAACGAPERSAVGTDAARRGAAGASDPRPSLVLISIDTLRADRLGCYGAERDTSPAIDALAAEGALFETTLAPTSWTLPSHVTLLTGQNPAVHGVTGSFDRIDPQRRTLAEHLANAGYRTAAFVSAPFLHASYGFGAGFDSYRSLGAAGWMGRQPRRRDHLASHGDQTASEVVDAALAWLERDASAPFFLFVHLWDPHYDYVPPHDLVERFDPDYTGSLDPRSYERNDDIHAGIPERDKRHLRARYDAEILWTDRQVGRLLDALRRAGRLDDAVVSLVSDHGEEFFEHGNKGHRKTLYEESVRVPWIVRHPPAVAAGRRVAGVVTLADVAPTLLALLGAPPLDEATGRDLSPFLEDGAGAVPERPALLVLRTRAALRGEGYKVVLDLESGDARHFDLAADPGEAHPADAAKVAPERLAQLRVRLAAEAAFAESLAWSEREPVELPEATRERLRELGYLDE